MVSRWYPNYHVMEKNRGIKKVLALGKCEDCGKCGYLIHHIDKTRYNHDVKNLRFLCQKCHMKYHKADYVGAIKYRTHGMTCKEISKKYNILLSRVYSLRQHGLLKKFIREPMNRSIIHPTKFINIYGFTCRELGKKLGISGERIRQLHNSNKLKNRLSIDLLKNV